jgi:hypothetical protein
MFKIDEAVHKVSDAAHAAKLPPNTVRSWFQRGFLQVGMTDKNQPNGMARLITGHTAMVIAVAAAFTRKGVSPEMACTIGQGFGHTGTGRTTNQSTEFRNAGCLFANGETWAVCNQDDPKLFGIRQIISPADLHKAIREFSSAVVAIDLEGPVIDAKAALDLERC